MAEEPRKRIVFDPTVHAGHLMTAATIIVCALTSWLTMRADIAALHAENAARKTEIAGIELKIESNRQEVSRNFEKLRDDMNGWFMALNDKLDRKADKR